MTDDVKTPAPDRLPDDLPPLKDTDDDADDQPPDEGTDDIEAADPEE
jgi:hypothetical protein